MTDDARAMLSAAISATADWLRLQEVKASTRDVNEPARTRKEKFDKRLKDLLASHFSAQKEAVRQYIERGGRLPVPEYILQNDQIKADITKLLIEAAKDGIVEVTNQTGIGFDNTLTNKQALEWATEYTGQLIKDIDSTTLDTVQSAIAQFIDKPGFTIGDVVDQLPFDPERAQRIAVTEITRAYAQGNQVAGEQLGAEFPGVKIVKTWFTNNDSLVCPICGPLNGQEVKIDKQFHNKETGSNIDNPPAHPNCRCWTTTTTKST
jgi:hypothetical protein